MRRGWLKAGASLAIALSLALKLAVLDVAVDEDQRAALRDLGAALAGSGYAVTVPRPDLPIVRGEHAGCAITARVLSPFRWRTTPEVSSVGSPFLVIVPT